MKLKPVVAPVRERGLKYFGFVSITTIRTVAPVRERGLKYNRVMVDEDTTYCRSREGAWIEI